MKTKLALVLISFQLFGLAQYAEDISLNNVSAIINNNTMLFNNNTTFSSGYNIPKDSNTNVIFLSNIWISGSNEANQLIGSNSVYTHEKFAIGPVANNYNTAEYLSKYSTSLWSVDKSDIDYHQINYNNDGYVVPNSILNWPGNGNISNGESEKLAPFIDLNNDGIYSPQSGDYPCIKGDGAKYIILNDANGDRTNSDSDSMNVELHVMIYQIENDNFLNETTFMEVHFINRSNITYSNVFTGQYIEFDIGTPHDDAIGCDSTRNILYAYNSDLYDEASVTSAGYKEFPPAAGLIQLNHETNSIGYFRNTDSFDGLPSTGIEYMNYMQGHYKDGSPFLNFDGSQTKFRYNANQSDDPDIFPSSLDISGYLSASHGTFSPESSIKLSYAIAFARSKDSTRFSPVLELLKTTDSIQEFYDNNIVNCGALSIDENVQEFDFNVFPNPAIELVNIQVEGQFQIELLDSKGSLVFTKSNCFGQEQINVAPFENGLYFIQVKTEKGIQSEKLMIK